MGKSALLIVDAQRGVLETVWQAERTVSNIAQLVDRAHERGVAVIWVQHASEELVVGSEPWQLAEPLAPRATDRIVHKSFNSAFAETTLDAMLKEEGVSHLILAGAATSWCIRSTAYAAVERGYDLTLVEDAHSTQAMELPDGTAVEAASIVAELNVVFRYLEAPGVKTSVLPSAEIPL